MKPKRYFELAFFKPCGSSFAHRTVPRELTRYHSSSPANAASKAFTQICRNYNITDECAKKGIEVCVRDTTQNGRKYCYGYMVKRVYSPKILEFESTGQRIGIDYTNKVKSLHRIYSKQCD